MTDKLDNCGSILLEFLNGMNAFLVELTDANRELLKALKEYQEVLVRGDTGTIEKATPGLNRIAGKIRVIDENRRLYVDEFYTIKGWDGARNFSALAEKIRQIGVTDDEGAAFDRAASSRMALIEILAEVDAQNSLNITLIGQSLSFAEVSLKALFGYENDKSTYGPSDETESGPSILDAQA